MIKITFLVILFFLIIFNCFSEENRDFCSDKGAKNIEFNKNFNICYSSGGVSIDHFDQIYNFSFKNHIETQFYFLRTVPTGFLCRDGILVGKFIPPPKYQPRNAVYIYELKKEKHGLMPISPALPRKLNMREYLITLERHEGQRLQAMLLLKYNGLKKQSKGIIYVIPTRNNIVTKLNVLKCRVEMTKEARDLNKLTMKRK